MKRFFDFILSLLAIIILSPLLLILSLTVLIDDGAPVIFKQDRVGKDNKLFKVYKFRTMKKNTANVPTAELKDAGNYITKSGRMLRKTSLDELPQLFNILKGDMSFVGPRPLIPEETKIRALRLENGIYSVRPGMTGLAQINGRDTLDDESKTRYDKKYIEEQSLLLDIKIIIQTVFVVLLGKDIVEGNEKTEKR
jgi:O-antigen biosynthesis protein WbqP